MARQYRGGGGGGSSRRGKKKEKKEKGLFGAIKRATRSEYAPHNITAKTARGFYDIGTGLPAGVVETGKVIGSGNSLYGILAKGQPVASKKQKAFGKAIAASTWSDLRHPLRDPASTFLTLGGILAALPTGGTSLGIKGGATVGKAGKLRTFEGIPEVPKSAKKGARGPSMALPYTKRYEVYASKNPLFRAGRNLVLEPAYKASRKRAIEGKRGGGYAKKRIQRTEADEARMAKQSRGEVVEARETGKIREVAKAPMNVVRMRMLLNPRYYLQNIAGTGAMLAAGGGSMKAAKVSKQMRKKDPDTYKKAQDTMGTGGMATLGLESTGGKFSGTVAKWMERANIPESHLRPVALIKAAMDEGIDNPQAFRKLLDNPDSQQFQRIAKRANERVVDYSRLGKHERAFISSQLPIFYAMTKGFTRYTARFPGEYPIKSAVAAQIGKEGKRKQREAFGELPWYAPYLIPMGDEGERAINPGPLYGFQPGLDVGRQVGESFQRNPQAGISLLQHLGPGGEIASGALGGFDPATGWTLKDLEELSRLEATLLEQGYRLGGPTLMSMLGQERGSKTYEPVSLRRQALLEALGTGLVPRPVRKSAREKWGKGKKKKRGSGGRRYRG